MTCRSFGCRAAAATLFGIAAVMLVLSSRSAWAEVGGHGFVVAVSSAGGDRLKTEVAVAADRGAGGVLFTPCDLSQDTMESLRPAIDLANQRNVESWLGIMRPLNVTATDLAHLGSLRVTGVAIVFPPPQGEPAAPGDFEAMLEIKRRGDQLGQQVRRIKTRIGEDRLLAVCVAASEIAPDTACDRYVPVEELIRDGTVDCVCLSGADSMNFHRLRLLRDAPLEAGIFLDARASEQRHWAGRLERAALAAVENPTCECLWLAGFPTAVAAEIVPQAVMRKEQAEAREKALAADIARAALAVDQEVSEQGCNDQATVHGVAQSFVPSRDGLCPLIQLYVAIRGCAGALPPPLEVEIREDDGGPGQTVVAKTEISAGELGHEPTYRWGSAYFDPPVPLRRGVKYWVHLPNARHPEGSFVWRIVKDGADQQKHAWSRSYDYSDHTWVFRVYLAKED